VSLSSRPGPSSLLSIPPCLCEDPTVTPVTCVTLNILC
jgi:hypothetical protein